MRFRRLFCAVPWIFSVALCLPRNGYCDDREIYGASDFAGSDIVLSVACLALIALVSVGFSLAGKRVLFSPEFRISQANWCLGLAFCAVLFIVSGLVFAFSRPAITPFGTDWSLLSFAASPSLPVGFIAFQTMVACLVFVTVYGSLGRRVSFAPRLALALLVSLAVFPLFLHWSRGDALAANITAFLANLDFVDLGGAVVVQATAGWAALAGLMVFGTGQGTAVARSRDDKETDATISSSRLAGHAVLLLAWIGVSCLSALTGSAAVGPVLFNSLLAAFAGGVTACLIGRYRHGSWQMELMGIGLLGGVISSAAGIHLFGAFGALLMGSVGAIAAIAGNAFVARGLKISDPLGIVGITAFAGAAGAVLFPFVANDTLPAGNRLDQIWVQAVGVGINFYWSFGLTYLAARAIRAAISMRKQAASQPCARSGTEEADRLAALAKATFEAIMIHRNGIVVDGNDELAKLLGRPLNELIGRSIFEFLRDGRSISVSEIIKLNDDASHEITMLLPSGEEVPVAARGRDITFLGEKARVGCFVDLRERREAEKRIRHLAQHDPLTGLPNRVLFTERLTEFMRGSRGHQIGAVVIIDFDRFKDINDLHGHQAGDAVIREVAARFAGLVGPQDVVARLGGDEFAAILDGLTTEEEIEAFGGRILAVMAAPIEIRPDEHVNVTVSIGAAFYPAHAEDLDTLIGCADMALFHAKASGRNAFRVFRRGMNDLIDKRRALEQDLELALHRGEFELYLQPRINVADLSVTGYEALLRWPHPTRGMVGPADFIPVAEASGKIIQLGEWVLAEAVRLLDRIDGHISVNVSPLQFRHADFVANLADLLARTGADPRRIELEITESVLIDDDQRAVQILTDLKKMGFAIALDDFGTGYSSLSYLSRYPFDTIKIDRSFVQNLSSADKTRLVVRTIIDLGEGLGMKVVAEGVETIEEAQFLGLSGCHELQGYLFGRPARISEIAREVSPDLAASLSLKRMAGRMADADMATKPSIRREGLYA